MKNNNVFTYKFNKIFDYIGGNNMKTIKKIVITGGPCSGKSTMLNLIENTFKEKGYKVLIVSETATELIRGGISPLGGKENMFIFQDYLLNLQLKKEEADFYQQIGFKLIESEQK